MAAERPQGGSRKLLIGTGVFALVAGGLVLALAAASLFGGGDDRPDVDVIALTSTPSPETTDANPTPREPGPPPLGDSPYQMVIDKISVDAPVMTYGLDENQIPVIPTGDDAAEVVAWYNFSAQPGSGSNAVFAGHVTWFGEAVFYNLTQLVPGDQIKLVGDDGTELVYAVSDVFAVSEEDPNGRDVMFATPDDVLTIITCDGTWIPDPNDRVSGGHYTERAIVRASLQSVTPGNGAG